MSAIKSRNRKPLSENLNALTLAEKIVKQSSEFCYNEKKIPKRRRDIGNRILNHSIDLYEDIRAANTIYSESAREQRQRVTYEYRAEKASMDLASDINLLPVIIPGFKIKASYTSYQKDVINCYNSIKSWRRYDEAKQKSMENEERKFNNKNKKLKSIKNTRINNSISKQFEMKGDYKDKIKVIPGIYFINKENINNKEKFA